MLGIFTPQWFLNESLDVHHLPSPQVKKVKLSKDESLTILGYGGTGPELLANETLMSDGQVIRSSTNQVQIYYRSLRQTDHGMFSLHYQGKFRVASFLFPIKYFFVNKMFL